MKRRAVWGALVFAVAIGGVVAALRTNDRVSCGPGFVAIGARCCRGGGCDGASEDVPEARVTVPETTLVIGPSDWEAEGRVTPRTLHVRAFSIDAFEATIGLLRNAPRDRARAAGGVTRGEAIAFCSSRGGRLPTEDEWIAAAAGVGGARYPWGDTGAVCRRAAWGLASGPCSILGTGPDTVGAHPDGDTPTKIHDMAGNVAEWVTPEGTPKGGESTAKGIARGGSWKTALAADLRTWARLELDPSASDPGVGVRCAYDLAP